MIKLERSNTPDILEQNKERWTNVLLEYIKNGEKVPSNLSKNYNQDEVKESLRNESHSKCIYCESKVDHVAYEHIEHLKPKAKDKYPKLAFEYKNLGLACPKCNMNKGAKYDEDAPFINPYEDDPNKHFNAVGAYVWAESGDNRAKLTEIEIELNRAELLEFRGERLKTIRSLIELYKTNTNPTVKQSLKEQIMIEIADDKPYSFITRNLVKALLQDDEVKQNS